jgi:hypothetical protein
MKSKIKVLYLIFFTVFTIYFLGPYLSYQELIRSSIELCTPPNNTRFGSFSCKNFRADYTLDTSGTLPFISGADLILYADHVYDNRIKNVHSVKHGQVVYVKTDFIDEFFTHIYPKITESFVLITHNSDYSTSSKHAHYLDEDKLLGWFGQNPGFEHRKHFPLPIGFENPTWVPSKVDFIRSINVNSLIPWKEREYLLYINFNSNTNPGARTHLMERFKNIKDVLVSTKRVDYPTYMNQMGNSKFVLCPQGNGIDTHRFYETILMGSIPVAENSTLHSLFDETASFVVDSMSSLTVDMLRNASLTIQNMNFNARKVLLWQTWKDKIDAARSKF